MTNQQLLKIAKAAALQAAPLFKKNFGRAKNIRLKNHDIRSEVTEADVAIEKLICLAIGKRFPKPQFLGEEISPENKDFKDVIWIIDPIDGTTNYIQGIPLCCVSIAAWDKAGPLAAVLYNPVSGVMLAAAKGKGAFCNGKKLRVSDTASLNYALGGLGWFNLGNAQKLFSALIKLVKKVRVLATTAWQLGMVGIGNYDFFVASDMHVWDIAAGILIIKEAGGEVTDWQGKSPTLKTTNIVASNGKLHSQLFKTLKKLA